MKVLNSVADRILRRFVPSLTASAHSCPIGMYHFTSYTRSGCQRGGFRIRHRCCYNGSGTSGCVYTSWSPCIY